MSTTRWIALATCLIVAPLFAADDDAPKPRTVVMTITPAAQSVPAFKYRLWPDPSMRTAGNAVVFYGRSLSAFGAGFGGAKWPQGDRLGSLLAMPLAELKRLDPSEAAYPFSPMEDLQLAARKRTVDWELWERLRAEGIGMILPDLQNYRQLGALLAMRARLQLATEDYTGAARSLEACLSLAHNLCKAPTLIHALVGAAIAEMALTQVEEWVRTPGSPNLYWALTDLPSPLIDLRDGFGGERVTIDHLFPGLREKLADSNLPSMSVTEIRDQCLHATKSVQANEGILDIALAASQDYPAAKRFLRDRGWPDAQIEVRPALQVVLMHQVAQYDAALDDMTRIMGLPWPERLAAAKAMFSPPPRDQRWLHPGSEGVFNITRFLLPAVKVHFAPARIERRIVALRVIEAIRAHAAAAGSLPASLADVKGLYVPLDPLTGAAFTYSAAGSVATLTAAPIPGEFTPSSSFIYTITLGAK
ncbi:MAG: hypothetical protein ACJ8C4_05995 [Gemmataceae bacterium]